MDTSLIIGAFDSCKVVSSAFLIFLVILYVVAIDVTIKIYKLIAISSSIFTE